MIPLLRTAWIWTASAILILLWTPLLGVVRLFDREPRRLRTGRWFRKLGRVLAGVNPWRIHISGGENLHANQVYVVVSNHQSDRSRAGCAPDAGSASLGASWRESTLGESIFPAVKICTRTKCTSSSATISQIGAAPAAHRTLVPQAWARPGGSQPLANPYFRR